MIALAKGLSLVTTIFITQFFDRTTSGLLFFILGLITLSGSVATLGLAPASSYYYSRNLRRHRQIRNWQIFNLSLLISIIPSAIISLGVLLIEEVQAELFSIIYFIVMLSCFGAAARQMSKMIFTIEQLRNSSLFHDNVTYNFVFIIVILTSAAVTHEEVLGSLIALLAIFFSSTVSGTLAILHTSWKLNSENRYSWFKKVPPLRYIRIIICISLPSMITQGSSMVLNKIDIVMIGPFAGTLEVATYAVAMRLTYVSGLLSEILSLILAPMLINIGASSDHQRKWDLVKKVIIFQTFSTALIAVLIAFYHKFIIFTIFGEGYSDASSVFLILLIGKSLTCIFAPILILFTAMGYSGNLARVAIGVAIFNLTLNFLLIPSYGAVGAAVATSASLSFMFLNFIRITSRIHRATM